MAKDIIPQKKFYVYIIRDPRPGKNRVPVYIGKGKGRRAYSHQRNGHKHGNRMLRGFFVECNKCKLDAPVEIVKYFDSEEKAFAKEITLIAKYGRRDLKTGTLYNQTIGGDGVSGSDIKRWWAKPKFREKCLASLLKFARANGKDPVLRKANSRRLREEHARKEKTNRAIAFEKVVTSARFKREQSRRFSHTLKRLWSDPRYYENGSAANRKRQRSPKVRKARSVSALQQWSDPKFARRNRAQLRQRNKSREQRRRVSLAKKRYWAAWRKANRVA